MEMSVLHMPDLSSTSCHGHLVSSNGGSLLSEKVASINSTAIDTPIKRVPNEDDGASVCSIQSNVGREEVSVGIPVHNTVHITVGEIELEFLEPPSSMEDHGSEDRPMKNKADSGRDLPVVTPDQSVDLQDEALSVNGHITSTDREENEIVVDGVKNSSQQTTAPYDVLSGANILDNHESSIQMPSAVSIHVSSAIGADNAKDDTSESLRNGSSLAVSLVHTDSQEDGGLTDLPNSHEERDMAGRTDLVVVETDHYPTCDDDSAIKCHDSDIIPTEDSKSREDIYPPLGVSHDGNDFIKFNPDSNEEVLEHGDITLSEKIELGVSGLADTNTDVCRLDESEIVVGDSPSSGTSVSDDPDEICVPDCSEAKLTGNISKEDDEIGSKVKDSLMPESDVLGSVVLNLLNKEGDEVRNKDPDATAELLEKTVQADGQNQNFSDGISIAANATVEILEKPVEADGINQDLTTEIFADSVIDGRIIVNGKPCYYMVKLPRYQMDENFEGLLDDAQHRLAEETKNRDDIQTERLAARAKCKDHLEVIREAKAARAVLSTKRKEMNAFTSVIDKVNAARQIDEIDYKIRSMETKIQHETLALKEEKQFIRDIKQLKKDREQLARTITNQTELLQAIDEEFQAEENLKALKKEADQLRKEAMKVKGAEEMYGVQQKKLKELDTKYENANSIRQKAYECVQMLKNRAYEKRKIFSQYKIDAEQAKSFLFNKDIKGLSAYCTNQADRFMGLWNEDDEFRNDYVRCNLARTVAKFGTADGRSLGPNEMPAEISPIDDNPTKAKEPTAETSDDKMLSSTSKKSSSSSVAENTVTTSSINSNSDVVIEEPESSNSDKKTEVPDEKSEEEKAAELKEQRRLEEKEKAKEAMERKKRRADKAQARAAFKEQKLAEQREKARQKRARRKKTKSPGSESSEPVNEADETSNQEDQIAIDHNASETKKPLQPKVQLKSKLILRPGRKRKNWFNIQPWMWVALAALISLTTYLIQTRSFPLLEKF